jgi:hypothetical protein
VTPKDGKVEGFAAREHHGRDRTSAISPLGPHVQYACRKDIGMGEQPIRSQCAAEPSGRWREERR